MKLRAMGPNKAVVHRELTDAGELVLGNPGLNRLHLSLSAVPSWLVFLYLLYREPRMDAHLLSGS